MSLRFPAFANATIRHPNWLRASDLALATWVKLACRCAEDENGGRLVGLLTWEERMLLTYANVTVLGVTATIEAGLCRYDEDKTGVVVLGYDHEAETKLATARGNGRFGVMGAEHGSKGGRPRKDGALSPQVDPQDKTPSKPPAKPPGGVSVSTPETRNPPPAEGVSGGGFSGQSRSEKATRNQVVAKPPQGVIQKPPLSDPIRSLPTRGREGSPPAPKPPGGANGTSGADRDRLWSGWVWFGKFRSAWTASKQTGAYGRGQQDSRAVVNLESLLSDLPQQDRVAAQERAQAMFGMYLGETKAEVADAGHPFSWFVARFNGYRSRVLAKPAAAAPPGQKFEEAFPPLPRGSRGG